MRASPLVKPGGRISRIRLSRQPSPETAQVTGASSPTLEEAGVAFVFLRLHFALTAPRRVWLTDWTDNHDEISWELDVVKAGNYELELRYLAPDIGDATIQISDGKTAAKAALTKTTITDHPVIPDRVPRTEVPERNWATMKIGKLALQQGRTTLRLSKTGGPIEVKGLQLHKR